METHEVASERLANSCSLRWSSEGLFLKSNSLEDTSVASLAGRVSYLLQPLSAGAGGSTGPLS
jgi:hypothetical protein